MATVFPVQARGRRDGSLGKVLAAKPGQPPEFSLRSTHSWRESTPTSCPLSSTHVSCHTHEDIYKEETDAAENDGACGKTRWWLWSFEEPNIYFILRPAYDAEFPQLFFFKCL